MQQAIQIVKGFTAIEKMVKEKTPEDLIAKALVLAKNKLDLDKIQRENDTLKKVNSIYCKGLEVRVMKPQY